MIDTTYNIKIYAALIKPELMDIKNVYTDSICLAGMLFHKTAVFARKKRSIYTARCNLSCRGILLLGDAL